VGFSKQRHYQNKSKIRLDRKGLLDEIGFVWEVDFDVRQAHSIATRVTGEDQK
jgi:hypothetical protein